MKKYILFMVCALLLYPFAAHSAEYELSIATTVNPSHPIHISLLEVCKTAEEKSGGRLTFHIFDNGTLAKGPQMLKVIGGGGADMGVLAPSFFPSSLPRYAVHDMGFLCKDATSCSRLALAMTNMPEIQEELSKANILFLISMSGTYAGIGSINAPIRSLADFRGKRVLTTLEPLCKEIEAWGGTPVQVLAADLYVGLQRGLGDMVYMPMPVIYTQRLHELLKYLTLMPSGMSANNLGINKDLFESMPKDIQQILLEMGGESGSVLFGRNTDELTARQLDTMRQAGVEVITLTDAELRPWVGASNKGMEPYWIDLLQRGGVTDSRGWIKQVRDLATSLK